MVYYACIPGCLVEICIWGNYAAYDPATGRNVVALSLSPRVYRGAPHEDAVFRRCERNARMLVKSDDNIVALRGIAESLIESLECDYGLAFLRGADAIAERTRVFALK